MGESLLPQTRGTLVSSHLPALLQEAISVCLEGRTFQGVQDPDHSPPC